MKVPGIEIPLSEAEFVSETGSKWRNPKEAWGFLRQGAKQSKPVNIAKSFIRTNQTLLGLENVFAPKDKNDPILEHVRTLRGLGGYHVLFRQLIGRRNVPLFRAFVTVHMNNKKQVYMCKNRAIPKHMLDATRIQNRLKWSEYQTKKAVLSWILEENQRKASKDIPFRPPYPVDKNHLTFRRNSKLYYRYDHEAYLCWCIRVSRVQPKEEWLIYVQADDPKRPVFIKAENDAIAEAGKKRKAPTYDGVGRAYVFDPNPVAGLSGGHQALIRTDLLKPAAKTSRELQERLKPAPEEAYKFAALEGLDGSGYLKGRRVQIRTPRGKPRLRRRDGDFRVWARVPGSQHPTGFEEVMAYYHINSVLQYLEQLGYKDGLALFKKPLVANVYYTEEDDAWYNGETRQLYFGTGEISEAEDGETIVHELGHAVQDHICPDFGQTPESSAMGEGFADYLAMSVFHDKKTDTYRKTVMSWDGLALGLRASMQPPALRAFNKGARTLNYKKFNKSSKPHKNGSIWAATLLDIHKEIGRKRADKIIIDSHFELSSHATFSRGARAIVHANRNLFGGKYEARLKKVFRRRKIYCGY